jgi:2-polyprenyl-3-methyl-5-hydroxy-6-metoxy-1,4-benzoquinol methylase
VFLNPRPKSQHISGFYQSPEYQPFLSTQFKLSFFERLYTLIRALANKNKLQKILKLKETGRILDIGCGTGEFLNIMQQTGWETFGVEKDQAAVDFASSAYKLNIKAGELADAGFGAKQFDVITMWHVLEHVYFPVVEMERIRNLLKNDGILLIALPNIASPDAQFYRQNWVALDAPRHLTHFTKKNMEDLCKRTGFEILETAQLIQDAFFNSLMSEKVIVDRLGRNNLFFLIFAFRALYISLKTIYLSSRFSNEHFGSSTLYIIKKT